MRGVIHLLDIRHEPTENDLLMKEWLSHYDIPILIVATKADKISRGARQKNLQVISRKLNLDPGLKPIVFSAQTGEGTEELHKAIEEIIG